MSEFVVMLSQLIPKPIIPADILRSPEPAPARKVSTYGVPRTKDMTLLTCTKCGKATPVATGYYIRATGTKTHVENAPMQPCKICTKKKQALYRERMKTRAGK